MTTITSTTILRSRNAVAPDKVLSTLLLRYPRCIHSELMTHRVFSRNAASSRAIPVEKLIKDVEENPFIPVFWGLNQRGMQATQVGDELVRTFHRDGNRGESYLGFDYAEKQEAWLAARDNAIVAAKAFAEAGYHKQIVNRLLEPFAHITVLVSSTEWDNFLELRDHPDAEPHIQILAREIRKCLDREDDIQELQPGEWHLPFANDEADHKAAWEYVTGNGIMRVIPSERSILKWLTRLSVARCASTSYKTVDGFDMTVEKAVELHDRLVGSTPIHASPAEHVAQADDYYSQQYRGGKPQGWQQPEQHGNFVGFRQYRHML